MVPVPSALLHNLHRSFVTYSSLSTNFKENHPHLHSSRSFCSTPILSNLNNSSYLPFSAHTLAYPALSLFWRIPLTLLTPSPCQSPLADRVPTSFHGRPNMFLQVYPDLSDVTPAFAHSGRAARLPRAEFH
jgi:hypothetical protein